MLDVVLLVGCGFALAAWLVVLALPWQPHRTRERIEAEPGEGDTDLREVCVLIPARDEAGLIGRTIAALKRQGSGLQVVIVDDQSSDGTADACTRAAAQAPGAELELRVIHGAELPPGWAGKLWALEQGLAAAGRPFVLLLDADIELARGTLPVLLHMAHARNLALVSIMAELHCATFWERLLTPPFVFFFKLLYPFALANDPRRRTAAAAGGCMLVSTTALRDVGGFAAIRGALIDDCTLAAALKRRGHAIWLGMSHSVRSLRVYASLGDFWQMVSRSAFTQLRYSTVLLVVATLLLLVTLALPPVVSVLGLAVPSLRTAAAAAAAAWAAAAAAYWPVVRFYRLPALSALTLPAAAALFLAMTWSSAWNYWRGTRAMWKNRNYGAAR